MGALKLCREHSTTRSLPRRRNHYKKQETSNFRSRTRKKSLIILCSLSGKYLWNFNATLMQFRPGSACQSSLVQTTVCCVGIVSVHLCCGCQHLPVFFLDALIFHWKTSPRCQNISKANYGFPVGHSVGRVCLLSDQDRSPQNANIHRPIGYSVGARVFWKKNAFCSFPQQTWKYESFGEGKPFWKRAS